MTLGIQKIFMVWKRPLLGLLILAALAYCGLIFFLYAWRQQSVDPDMKNISLDEQLFKRVNEAARLRLLNLEDEKTYSDPFN